MCIINTMKVQSINNTNFGHANVYGNFASKGHIISGNYSLKQVNKLPSYDCAISFTGISHGGDKLRKLVRYGIPDMYTGQPLLDSKTLEYLQYKNIFSKPLKELLVYLKPHEDTLIASGKKFYKLLKETAKTNPDYTLSKVVKENRKEHEKLLLKDQSGIFYRLIYRGMDLPNGLKEDFDVLTNITTKRLYNDPVVLPFSETEFKYKLKRIAETVRSRNNRNEMSAMRTIEKMADKLFKNEKNPIKTDALNYSQIYPNLAAKRKGHPIKATLRKKLEHQMQPEVLKKNADNLAKIREFFEGSALKDNTELSQLFENTNAKIHGYPFYAKFERKSFLYELKKITKQLKDRDYAHELMNTAIGLPTSYENLSAFIVKYSGDTSDKIGYFMMRDSLVSIDHLVPKKGGGANTLRNFGLSSAGINREKSNIPFAEFVKIHPETYVNCQKHVDRLIELCNQGIFDKLEIPRSYIKDFADTIYKISPPEKRLVLDISKLKEG